MFSLNLPAFDAKIAMRDGKRSIFDVVRRRYVALTRIYSTLPERPVRAYDCGIQGSRSGNYSKGFRPDYPLQYGIEGGLSDSE